MSDENNDSPRDPFSGMAVAAASLHELYRSWVESGFTPEQALSLATALLVECLHLTPPPQT